MLRRLLMAVGVQAIMCMAWAPTAINNLLNINKLFYSHSSLTINMDNSYNK